MTRPPPIPEQSFKRPMRDADKIRQKRVVRVDTPHILTFFLTSLLVVAAAFVGGVVVEQQWPEWTWWPWLSEQIGALSPAPAPVAFAPDRTLPATDDALAPIAPAPVPQPPAQVAAMPPIMAPGRVDPIEMGPRPVSQAYAPVEAEHPAAVGEGGSVDEGTLEMPTFVLDSGNNDALAFTIQVKAFREEPQAQVFLSDLRTRGYEAWLVQSDMPDQEGVWWRVRIGRFATMTEASDYQRTFEEKENLSTFVSPL